MQKYTLDAPTKATGGKFTVVEKVGQCLSWTRKRSRSARARSRRLSPPSHGWHILQALGPVKPGKQAPLSSVAGAIRKALGQRDQTAKVSRWVSQTTREYCLNGKVKYEKGYKPIDDPCAVH